MCSAICAVRTSPTARPIVVEPAGHGWNNGIVALPDGRLVMGISAACDHCLSHSRWSGTIVSFRPDGSDVRVYASGIRAPFGVAYDSASGGLLTSMNQRDDLGDRDARGLARARPRGAEMALPGLLRPGRECVPRRAGATRSARQARGRRWRRGRRGTARGQPSAALRSGQRVGARARVLRSAVAHRPAPATREHAATPLLDRVSRIRCPSPSASGRSPVSSATGRVGIVYRVARA